MLIKPILAGVLEAALKRYLSLDSDAGVFLAPLAGKVIAVSVTPFNWTFYLSPTKETVQVLETYAGEPDTTLSGSLLALGLMSFSDNPMQNIFAGEVQISGDVHTGRALQKLFGKLDVDLEEQLAHVTGDVIAHQIGRFARGGQRWGRQVLQNLRMDVAEYLHDESRDLPSAPELEIFFRQIDALRHDHDRLQARIERLEKILANTSENS